MNPTVFVIDDDEDMRNALGNLFRSVGHEVKLFGSTAEFLKDAPDNAPGCLVLDVRLPGMSGLDFQNKLSGTNVEIPIVFMTGHGDVSTSVRAMKGGAVDFLEKPFRAPELLACVQRGLARSEQSRVEGAQRTAIERRFATLTSRERDVLWLVVTGLLNKQIAGELGIAEKTVKIHRGQVMQKMEAGSVAELVPMAQKLRVSGATP